jgi:hypothetical protein
MIFAKIKEWIKERTLSCEFHIKKNLKKPCISSLKMFENPNPRVIRLHYDKICSYDKNDFTKIVSEFIDSNE